MKVVSKVIVIFLLFCSSIYSSEETILGSLLSKADLELQRSDHQRGPALRAGSNTSEYWESYNQWFCVSSRQIELTTSEVFYDGKRKVLPHLTVKVSGHIFEYALSAETEFDNEQIYSKWNDLLKAKSVCIYGAYFGKVETTSLGETSSLWILRRLKTERGIWAESEY